MTPSEKPGESASQSKDASHTSVITQSEEATESTAERGTPAAEDQAPNHGEEAAALDGTDAPPPWQRGAATSSAGEQPSWPTEQPAGTSGSPAGAGGAPDSEDTQKIPRPAQEQETARNEVPQSSSGGRTAVTFGSAGRATSAAGSARRPSRGPRRASLQVKRVDPWSVLKLALVLSVALFFVWMIAVAVLYGVLDGMGVWDQLNGTFTELTQPDDAAAEPLISAGRVFGVASIIGAINIVLITALATVAAFIYNVAADFAGGVEVTLSERE